MDPLTIAALAGGGYWIAQRRKRPALDAAAEQQWQNFYRYADVHDLDLLWIREVYQRAGTGSKAHVHFYGDPVVRDAWFWWTQVQPGQVVAVQPAAGWGPHTERDGVLYIGEESPPREGVWAAIGADTLKCAARHRQAGTVTRPV